MISVGERLQDERIRKNISLEKVASATKIKLKFLSDIEKGNYKNLPSGYALGFVRNYSKFLGLPENEMAALFRREFDAEKEMDVLPVGMTQESTLTRLKIGRSMVLVGSLFIILTLYILYQYRAAILNPSVNVTSPKENATLPGPTVEVVGKTEPDSTVTIGSETASIDNTGSFKKQILLFPGKTTIQVVVTNRFGRQTTIMRHIDVKAAY